MTKLSYSDDVATRFQGYHWHVISINGNDQSQCDAALKEAKATKGRPTIIIGKTIIGHGSPKLQGTPKAHSDAFGPEEVAATKKNLGWPVDAQFLVPQRVKDFFAGKRKEWAKDEAGWNQAFRGLQGEEPGKGPALAGLPRQKNCPRTSNRSCPSSARKNRSPRAMRAATSSRSFSARCRT